MKLPNRPYNMAVGLYSNARDIIPVKGCFSFMFTNTGDTIAAVNEMVVYPGTPGTILGDSRTVSGHDSDIYKGVMKLSFQNPVGVLPQVEIVQLFYTDI